MRIAGLLKILFTLLLVGSLSIFLVSCPWDDESKDEDPCVDAINNAYIVLDAAYKNLEYDPICEFYEDIDAYLWATTGKGLLYWPGVATCKASPEAVLPNYIYTDESKSAFLDSCRDDWTDESIECTTEADTLGELDACIGL